MNTKVFYIASLFVLTLFISCNKVTERSSTTEKFRVYSFSAAYTEVNEPETKNEMGSVNYDVYWSSGDAIAVVNMADGTIHRYTLNASSVGKKYGVFDATGSFTYDDSDELVAVYPYAAASWEAGILYVTVQDQVEYHSTTDIPAFATNDIQVTSKMTGAQFKSLVESSSNLPFSRMVALFSVTCHVSSDVFRNEHLSSLSLVHGGICGKAPVQFNPGTGSPSIASNSGDGTAPLVINLPLSPTMSNANYAAKFIPVLPSNLGTGLYFIFTSTNYTTGFYRKVNANIGSNRVQEFSLFEGAYSNVSSQEEATMDQTWWYTLKKGGMNSSGSFGSEGSELGSTAGGFVE